MLRRLFVQQLGLLPITTVLGNELFSQTESDISVPTEPVESREPVLCDAIKDSRLHIEHLHVSTNEVPLKGYVSLWTAVFSSEVVCPIFVREKSQRVYIQDVYNAFRQQNGNHATCYMYILHCSAVRIGLVASRCKLRLSAKWYVNRLPLYNDKYNNNSPPGRGIITVKNHSAVKYEDET